MNSRTQYILSRVVHGQNPMLFINNDKVMSMDQADEEGLIQYKVFGDCWVITPAEEGMTIKTLTHTKNQKARSF